MARTALPLIFIAFLQHTASSLLRNNPLVQTKLGSILGIWETYENYEYAMFLGLPFAKVNETNPFGEALPHPGFDGMYEAYDDSVVCPQYNLMSGSTVGVLDCLRLNIFAPSSAQPGEKLPVLVWIHGGGFNQGSGNRERYHGRFLVKHDVIVVTLNYRMGPYGFLCLGIPEVPGNQGLKDQLKALRWVNENIEAFGGDPNQVTIFGESAGGMAVDTHLFSEPEKLFRRVIVNSGTAFTPEIASDPDSQAALKIAELLGFTTDNTNFALNFLTNNSSPQSVIEAARNLDSFYPCVEKKFDNVERFLGEFPLNNYPSDAVNITVLIGFNSHEYTHAGGSRNDAFFENMISNSLKMAFDFDERTLLETESVMRYFYIGDEEPNATQFMGLGEFESDFKFVYPAQRSIRRYLKSGAKNVFYYIFSYVGERNVGKIVFNVNFDGGAIHSDHLGYLFHLTGRELPDPISNEDQVMIERITALWTNFAKYGNPTPDITEILPVKWAPITSLESPLYAMNIGRELKMEMRPYHHRVAFWDLFYQRYQKYVKGFKDEDESSTNIANPILHASVLVVLQTSILILLAL